MSPETVEKVSKTFKFSYPTCTNAELLFKLAVPVEIPYEGSTRELVQRVLKMFHIPVYLEDELNEKLANFVSEETKNFHNERDAKLINQLKNNELNVDGVVKQWEKLFKENVVEFAEQKGSSDEEVFAAAYHKLVHSPALETIMQVESAYAKTVIDMLKNRDEDIKKLTKRQTKEMEEKVRLLNISTTEEEINALAAEHFEQQSLATGRWESQLDALRHTQRASHRTWIMAAMDEYQTDERVTPSNSPLCSFPTEQAALAPLQPRLEESFTIHLGSQLKQTHNIRLVSVDMMDLFSTDRTDGDTWSRVGPALSLYSHELSGVVVLEPAPPDHQHHHPLRRAPTDHHFPDVDTQLRHILEAVKEPAEKRNEERWKVQSSGGSGGGGGGRRWRRALQPGDVYVTRHSNLAEAHVIFHLVVDEESLKSGDMTSRHPAVLGLRAVLKAACRNDVTAVALPLLLRRALGEEATAAWCLRRADLVLKCVKGFVLEAAGGGGAPLRTLTAALPALPPALFAALAALLPTIFRVAGPVRPPRTPHH